MYNEKESVQEKYKLVTVNTVDQENVIDCGVLACYLASTFSKRLKVQDVTEF